MPMLLDLFDILPRIIGSLLAVIVARGSGWLVTEIPDGRQTGQWLIGCALGCHFDRTLFRSAPAFLG